ncbi:MAG: HAD-IA family hydrolase [Chloroflexi bacterium]|nr:HAD-IA family hydrolase [Chloroflexota bacterium]MCY3939356.1 HAD-IA family hydrolase [Chloroflexota bacterium]
MSNAKKPRFIFFDAFGTLFGFGGKADPPADFRRLLASNGVEVPMDAARTAIAQEMAFFRNQQRKVRTRDELEQLRRDCGILTIDALGGPMVCPLPPERVGQILADTFPNVAFPEVTPAVRLARGAGAGVGVLSNFSYLLPLILEDLGLRHLFDVVVFSAEVGAEKPDPAIFLEASRVAGVELRDAALIGDTYDEDVVGARSVDLEVVYLDRSGGSRRDDVPVARDLIEAVELLVGVEGSAPSRSSA